jgi:hypothetical protein
VKVLKSVKADVEIKKNYRALKFVLKFTDDSKFGVIRAIKNIISGH